MRRRRADHGGRAGWQPLAYRSESPSEIAFADLDGDATADAFRTGCL